MGNWQRHKLTIGMKAMLKIVLFVLVLQVIGNIQAADEDMQDKSGNCIWFGTFPFCRGECPDGTKLVRYDGSGDGVTCLTGYKAYCCTTEADESIELKDDNCMWFGTAPFC